MENSALISVVTPVFNGNDFLKSIYKCLCDQTYANWEWVVVDDGSTDDTWATLTEIARGDERVRCFSQHNSGSAKLPRDRAVYESRGEMILQLDVDDLLGETIHINCVKNTMQRKGSSPEPLFQRLLAGFSMDKAPRK